MTRSLILFVIGLFFGAGGGYLLAPGTQAGLSGHDHADPAAHAPGMAHAGGGTQAGMDHDLLQVTGPAPGLSLTLHPDAPGAVNLEILTTGFRFAPERVNGPAAPGEGHAHVYLDGVKIARVYGPWFQITGLEGGEEVRVTLNANSHQMLADGGAPIAAVATVP